MVVVVAETSEVLPRPGAVGVRSKQRWASRGTKDAFWSFGMLFVMMSGSWMFHSCRSFASPK